MRSILSALIVVMFVVSMALPLRGQGQGSFTVASERVVIDGYNEPNTPPNVPISALLGQAITDPAARNPDGTINLNKAIYLRFYDPNNPPRNIVIMFPTASSGANSLAILGTEIVRASNGDVEFWAIDRRSNLLEDATAIIQSEMQGTREAAVMALNAQTNHPSGRGGYLAGSPFSIASFMSEWGLDVHLRDAKLIVDRARARVGSSSRVFLGGPFLGAGMAQTFAAYSFDGTPGYSLIGGLIVLDFSLAPGWPGAQVKVDSLPENLYLDGGIVPTSQTLVLSGQVIPGLNNLRNPTRLYNINNPSQSGHEPFVVNSFEQPTANFGQRRRVPFEPYSLQLVEIGAQLALTDKDGISPIGAPYVPTRSTNEAAFGMIVDDEFQQVTPSRMSVGFLEVPLGTNWSSVALMQTDFGPPSGANPNGIFAARELGGMPQRWSRLKDLSSIGLRGREPSDFQTVARMFLYGSGQTDLNRRLPNALEWYMPIRLGLDVFGIAPSLDSSTFSTTLRSALMVKGGRGLALTVNRNVNVPILAIRAGQGLFQTVFAGFFGSATGDVIFTQLLETYRLTTSILPNQVKVRATSFPEFTHGDLTTSMEKGVEGKSVADFILDFLNGRL
jgi:hypothetical protein